MRMLAFAAGFVCAATAQCQHYAYRVVAKTGDPAPGLDATITEISTYPTVTPDGRVLMSAGFESADPLVGSGEGLWLQDEAGVFQPIAFTGMRAPGTPEAIQFDRFGNVLTVGASGTFWTVGFLRGEGLDDSNNVGVWRFRDGELSLAARLGDQVLGEELGVVFSKAWPLFTDRTGGVATGFDLSGGAYNENTKTGVWISRSGGDLERLIQGGDRITGIPYTAYYSDVNPNPFTDGVGRVLFRSGISTTPGGENWGDATWISTLPALPEPPLAVEGSPAPGTGLDFTVLSTWSLSSPNGNVVFLGTAGEGQTGIWARRGGKPLGLVAQESDPASEAGPNAVFERFSLFPYINDEGVVFFVAGDSSNEGRSLWYDDGTGPRLSAIRSGAQAPGLPAGTSYNFPSIRFLTTTGLLGVDVRLAGDAVKPFRENSLWILDSNRDVATLLFRVDGTFDVDPSVGEDVRTIDRFRTFGSWANQAFGISDDNEYFVALYFTDDTSAIIAIDLDTLCPADINNDGVADSADFFAWVNAFGNQAPECDVNRDTSCDSADFFAWVQAFGVGCGG